MNFERKWCEAFFSGGPERQNSAFNAEVRSTSKLRRSQFPSGRNTGNRAGTVFAEVVDEVDLQVHLFRDFQNYPFEVKTKNNHLRLPETPK